MNGRTIVAAWLIGAVALTMIAMPVKAEDKAVIKGKIIFKGEKDDYKRSRVNTDKDPNCAKSVKKIGSEGVILNKKTNPITIRNVLVSVKEGLGDLTFEIPSEPVVLDQHGCQYKPHVLGMMEGQELTVTNSDDTNHNIHFLPKKNAAFNTTQPKKGMKTTLKLVKEDAFKVKCDVHPWMGCYIAVFDHPFFDVTGKEGTFELTGLPPGTYVIEAWHEKFGTLTQTVVLGIDETKEADFTFEPSQ